MSYLVYCIYILLIYAIKSNGYISRQNQYKKPQQWHSLTHVNYNEVVANGDKNNEITDPDESYKNYRFDKHKVEFIEESCPTNTTQLQHLLRVVCLTAHRDYNGLREACIECFSKIIIMPEDDSELTTLGLCAATHYTNTIYAECVESLKVYSPTGGGQRMSGCYKGYCRFVRCLRKTNSLNLISQCTQEAKVDVNVTSDADNVRFYANVTSCILAKSRCGYHNPITGAPQVPGFARSGAAVRNALHFSEEGDLRIIAFPIYLPVTNTFCSKVRNFTETHWLNNIC